MSLNSKLLNPLFSSPSVAELLADTRFVAHMLQVEAALARTQGRLGIIPADASQKIAAKVDSLTVDWEQLAVEIDHAGIPVIELVRQLREHIGGDAASYIHWGATSQDIMDTAVILQIRAVLDIVDASLSRLISGLIRLVREHRHTIMIGRTHAQPALPMTFGFKVAGWVAPHLRHRERLRELKPRLLVVQFGGAVGTLAALGSRGLEVRDALAEELGLGKPILSWHTQRDTLVEFASWLSLVSGTMAKMAQDVILLAQSEVGELHETEDYERGGSSTMPQKQNPVISEAILAAARTNASLLSSMHNAMIQEHERGTHGWQMEWIALPQMMSLTAAALDKAVFLSENMVVDAEHMQRNVDETHGLMLAEAVSLALATHLGRAEAQRLVKTAAMQASRDNRHLIDVIREMSDARLDWTRLKTEVDYLGATDTLIDRLLSEADKELRSDLNRPV